MIKVKSSQGFIDIYYKRLPRNFYTRKTLDLAQELLGKFFVRRLENKILVGKIVETEAYVGPFDKASHAYARREQKLKEKIKIISKTWQRIKDHIDNPALFCRRILEGGGKLTERNIVEYLRGGHIYIYLVYGNYYQCNITTYKEGFPECVLIRAVEPIVPKNLKTNGPGLFCEAFRLDKTFSAEDLCKSDRVWISFNKKIPKNEIVVRPRIGIDYAEEHKHLLWRFYIKDNPWVSKK
jgi:DNA-3-methyladenine glycosylase